MTARLWPYLLLSLLCALLYLPGLAVLPPFDRDEAYFVQATRQMVASGDYVRIRFQDAPRHKKPIGIHWLQAASVHATGAAPTALWAYRLPSALAAWLAVLAAYGLGRRLFDPRAALIGAGLLGASLLLAAEAHQAKTDAALLAAVVAAQAALARVYLHARAPGDGPAPGKATALAFWAAQGAAILLKGPIGPAVSGLTVLALGLADREWRWLKGLAPALGVPVAVAIAAPWFVAVHLATGGAFISEAVGDDVLPKIVSAQESHGAPPGTYVAAMLASFWPGSLIALPAVAAAWRRRGEPAVRVCLAWLIPAWLLFEAMPTKLPHYVLPLYPALALLAGWALARVLADGRAAGFMRHRAARAYAGLWALLTLAGAAALVAAPRAIGAGFDWTFWPPAAVALAAGLAAPALLWRRRWPAVLAVAVAAPLLLYPWLGRVALPGLDRLWLSRELARAVAALPEPAAAPVAVAGYHEPSLVVLLGTGTRLVGPREAGAYLAATPGALAAVAAGEAAAFRRALEDSGGTARAVGRVAGFDYTHGEPLSLVLYRAPPADG